MKEIINIVMIIIKKAFLSIIHGGDNYSITNIEFVYEFTKELNIIHYDLNN